MSPPSTPSHPNMYPTTNQQQQKDEKYTKKAHEILAKEFTLRHCIPSENNPGLYMTPDMTPAEGVAAYETEKGLFCFESHKDVHLWDAETHVNTEKHKKHYAAYMTPPEKAPAKAPEETLQQHFKKQEDQAHIDPRFAKAIHKPEQLKSMMTQEATEPADIFKPMTELVKSMIEASERNSLAMAEAIKISAERSTESRIVPYDKKEEPSKRRSRSRSQRKRSRSHKRSRSRQPSKDKKKSKKSNKDKKKKTKKSSSSSNNSSSTSSTRDKDKKKLKKIAKRQVERYARRTHTYEEEYPWRQR